MSAFRQGGSGMREREHIAVLRRRADHLRRRLQSDDSENARQWMRAEIAALEWALAVLTAEPVVDHA